MYIKLKKFLGILGISLLSLGILSFGPFSALTVQAAEEETLGEELQRDLKWLYDQTKEKVPEVAGEVKEKLPEVIDDAKDAASDAIEKGKAAAPEAADKLKSVAGQASEAISDYRQTQEDEFVEWFENQTGTGDTATDTEAETDAETEATEETAEEETVVSEPMKKPDAAEPIATEVPLESKSDPDPEKIDPEPPVEAEPQSAATEALEELTTPSEDDLNDPSIVLPFALFGALGITLIVIGSACNRRKTDSSETKNPRK